MLDYERQAWEAGAVLLAGMDEAGRGPLAGPVVAAAVMADRGFLEAESTELLAGLTDSKKLTPARREQFFSVIQDGAAFAVGVGMAEADEIDRINILAATHLAMKRSLEELNPLPEHVLVDGNPVRGLPCRSTAIVKGDGLSLLIAAASIVAKVTRDRMMVEYDKTHPGYGFANHKGYGTREHLEALRRLGPCAIHRRSFEPVAQLHLF